MKAIRHHIHSAIPAALALVALCLVSTAAPAETVGVTYNSADHVPITASSFTATGNKLNFTLNYAPAQGTELMVVENTGLDFIKGTFDNLTNGQPVALSYGGVTYNFVANYYGGSGNDLVLVWANQRAYGWGQNNNGQLGDATISNRRLPVPMTATGVLAGQTVVALAAGGTHTLVLSSDGTVAACGANNSGQLGDNTVTRRLAPVAVNTDPSISALYGETVVAVAAGNIHSLALCSDGTVAAWGYNFYGQLGDNTTTSRRIPVPVNVASGVSALAGKTVVAIATGYYHSLALCSDGTVAAWGYNYDGQLGDNTTTNRRIPVLVNTAAGVSALAGKIVVAIAAGSYHSLALCSDGTVAAWGYNYYGQLGDNTTTRRLAPVAVNTNFGVSALYGETVVAIAAGAIHSLALCEDGTVTAWGYNSFGQLGDDTARQRHVPVAVNTDPNLSALYDESVAAIAAGSQHSMAFCWDGLVADWGYNADGQIGDNTTTARRAPVAAKTTSLAASQSFIGVFSGSCANHSLALVAGPLGPAINVTGRGLSVTNGDATPSTLDGTDFGTLFLGVPSVHSFTIWNVGGDLLNLTGTPSVAVSGPNASDFTVTLQPAASLIGGGSATFQVTFAPSAAGTRTATLSIASDDTENTPYTFAIQGTGTTVLAATYDSGSDVPLSVSNFTATGKTVDFTLNGTLYPSMDLMVVENTGLGFINGTFDNLAQGQTVVLTNGGTTYTFVANYYGGTGNDLVLVWADNRAFAWGRNDQGQLGNGTTTARQVPVLVPQTGALAGKTVLTVAAGQYHSLALCSDGTVAAWGHNEYGQLGDGTSTRRLAPVAVNTVSNLSGLYGKTVVAIAAGGYYSLALCSDGTVAAWGENRYGQLGDGSTTQRLLPVAVNTVSNLSALYGKTVVAIAAGSEHSLGLCSDGTVAAWGGNFLGQLGDNTPTQRNVPVAVNTDSGTSALFGRMVVAIAAGGGHSLALCSDGTVAAWGDNYWGQLGAGLWPQEESYVPVAVDTASVTSALYGETVVAIAAGGEHSLALCSDGAVAAWGNDYNGQLGDNGLAQDASDVPVAVNTDSGVSALSGETVVAITAGADHSLAVCSGGTTAAWGYNADGELGDNTITDRLAPVAVSAPPLGESQGFTRVISGSSASHTLALAVVPQINVTGQSLTVTNGDDTPSTLDGTDFGSVLIGTTITSVSDFTIWNVGNATLNLTGSPEVTVSGPNPDDFTVTVQPDTPLFGGGNTTFEVTFAPSVAGVRTATLSIASDALGNTPYTFAIQGSGSTVLTATYSSGSDVPLSQSDFTATGKTVNFTLDCALAPGTDLMVVENTGPGFINGTFDNLAQGQTVVLTNGGTTYSFVADYYGGDGNDLVLVWADNRAFAWGRNDQGQLGDTTTTPRQLPVPVTQLGALAGKTVLTVAAGQSHSLALCADGTVASWGENLYGQLGDGSTLESIVPVAVNTVSNVSGLYGKTVVAIAAGGGHSLALCSDGTVAAWGENRYGQLGDGSTTQRLLPVAVNTVSNLSALYSKTVVAIAAGNEHSLGLCSDGTVAAWGGNFLGQLGDNTPTQRNVPVAVNTDSGTSALFGSMVVAIAAGGGHSLALCSDGTVAAWGDNYWGQLGAGLWPQEESYVPVAVDTGSDTSALYGETVVAIAAGGEHSLALCSDGAVAAWGNDYNGQLGDNGLAQDASDVPVAVNTDSGVSALSGATAIAITAGADHSLAVCSNGIIAAWGYNADGELGDNSATDSLVPVAVSAAPLAGGQSFARVISGSTASHTLALVAAPPASEIVLTATQTLTNGFFQFSFANTPGAFFGVLAATDPTLGLTNWAPLGDVTEVTPGQFQFTDPQATNNPQRFYRVRSP